MPTPSRLAARFVLHRAARLLRSGGIIAYPTEAVYGLGCNPLDPAAVLRLLAIKQRSISKGLILIASRFEQVEPFVTIPNDEVRQRIDASWPGPNTWLLPAKPDTPRWLRGDHPSLAVRVTAHPMAAALCNTFGGALVSTSANTSGRPPARSALQARLRCPGIDLVINGATGGATKPTAIRNALTGDTLRAG